MKSVGRARQESDPTTRQGPDEVVPVRAPGIGGKLPFVSLVVPAFNEADLVEQNLGRLCAYMADLEDRYRWEIVFVNDGSADETGVRAEHFARGHPQVRVFHHPRNYGAGQAFRFAFGQCRGDYVLTLDMDLSYAPDHIERLLEKIQQSRAKIVITSPYMKGGQLSNVPWLRRTLSTWANRFLSASVGGDLSTLTSMVRVYDRRFLQSLNLRAMGMGIMPEIIHKALMLGARIEEIPAHLDWGALKGRAQARRAGLKMMRHTMAVVLSGFLFRPFIFFVVPGLTLLAFAAYVNGWMLVHFAEHYRALAAAYPSLFERAAAAVAAAYAQSPHTFVIGLLSLMLAIQLLSLGILALQSKSYFEEVFHLGSTILRGQQSHPDRDRA